MGEVVKDPFISLPEQALQPGETALARAPVFWTDRPARQPNRSVHLYSTDRHLILVAPRVNPLVLAWVGWTVFGLAGAAYLGLVGAVLAGAGLFLLHTFLPRQAIRVQSLAMVAGCTLSASEGVRRLLESDVVEIRFKDATAWRMNPYGRNGTSPARIVAALEQAGLRVLPRGGGA